MFLVITRGAHNGHVNIGQLRVVCLLTRTRRFGQRVGLVICNGRGTTSYHTIRLYGRGTHGANEVLRVLYLVGYILPNYYVGRGRGLF